MGPHLRVHILILLPILPVYDLRLCPTYPNPCSHSYSTLSHSPSPMVHPYHTTGEASPRPGERLAPPSLGALKKRFGFRFASDDDRVACLRRYLPSLTYPNTCTNMSFFTATVFRCYNYVLTCSLTHCNTSVTLYSPCLCYVLTLLPMPFRRSFWEAVLAPRTRHHPPHQRLEDLDSQRAWARSRAKARRSGG